MRTFFLSALIGVAVVSSASATIVTLSSTPNGRTAVDASLATLPNGDQVLIGKFATPNAISLSLGSVANILSAGGWSQFDGAKAIGTFINPGKVVGTATDNTAAADAFNFLNAYIVIFNTTSAATATQMGIYRATSPSGSNDAWVFPKNNGGAGDSITIGMDEVSMTAIGGVGSVTEVPQQRFILAALIPEPSAVGLVGCGILSLLGYRRLRRRS